MDSTVDDNTVKNRNLYAKYALFVLMLVYLFNVIDRQILAILSEDIKSDLGISDSQMGFLYGTVFAIFYTIFGIPLGKLSDVGVRKNVISAGLGFWSLMTALSGLARSFFSLSVFRIGVGVGEASASPAIYSLLADYFSPRLRATVISFYSCGIYLGSGLGLYLGGFIVDHWNMFYPEPQSAPFELAGWQVAFIIVGLPGLLMAAWVYTLKEPVRGLNEGIPIIPNSKPFSDFVTELQSIVFPFTLLGLIRHGAHRKVIVTNLAVALLLAFIAYGIILKLGAEHIPQWVSVGIGMYGVFSWMQSLKIRDHATYSMIFRSKSVICGTFGFSTISFVITALSLWAPAFFIRTYNLPASEVGQNLGFSIMVGGLLGINFGGMLSDWLKVRYPSGRLILGLIVIAMILVFGLIMFTSDNSNVALTCYFVVMLAGAMWVSSGPALIADLVMPRMRAIASAFFIFISGLVGYAFGPYTIGLASDLLTPVYGSNSLRYCLIGSLGILVVGAVLLLRGMAFIGLEESSRLDRARQLGEI